jgi:hypothetical protein
VDIGLTTTSSGLVFLALACHQHLLALFRAICDAISHYLQLRKEKQQRDSSSRMYSNMAASSVAQSVMVLQLLIYLTNRMDRSLFQNSSLTRCGAQLSNSGLPTPITPNMTTLQDKDSIQPQEKTRDEPAHIGFLSFVHNIVRTIPDEHEKSRRVVQKLQVDIRHPELY